MPKLAITCVLFTVAHLAVCCTAGNAAFAQSWRDPAYSQPLPQYYGNVRYPLNDTVSNSTASNEAATNKSSLSASPGAGGQMPRPANSPSQPSSASPALDIGVDNSESGWLAENPMTGRDDSNEELPTPLNAPIAAPRQASPQQDRHQQQSQTRPMAVERTPVTPTQPPSNRVAMNTKPNQKTNHAPTLSWELYRDTSKYPIDPRKPCSVCKRETGSCQCGCVGGHQCLKPGNQGKPYQDLEPGGRNCNGHCGCRNRPEFSVYWPKPFSAKRANNQCNQCGCGCKACEGTGPKVNDLFDHLADFKLIKYQRTDNGYCGPNADPWGCLGEERSRAAGIGFRFPSEPVQR